LPPPPHREPADEPQLPVVAQATEAKPAPTPGEAAPDLAELWQKVHDLAAESAATQFIVESIEATAIRIAGGTLVVSVAPTIGALGPPTPAQTAKIEAIVGRAAGRPVKLEARAPTPAAKTATPAPAPPTDAAARAQAVNHPLVKRAMELFDAKLVRVDKPTER
jgi:hypothetical protein